MLARVATFAIDGFDPRPVWVEVDIRPGLPAFTIVGLADAAVREARERVRAAILNSGFEFPQRRITANLAPADLRKIGPGFDLALATAVLAASGQVPADAVARYAVAGELSLSGEVRSCRGALAVAEGARRAGLEGLVLALEDAAEAAVVEGLTIAGVVTLRSVCELLHGREPPVGATATARRPPARVEDGDVDFADVRGHVPAIGALEIAAAGGHNVLLQGPPGTGKTMLARRLPTILPPLSRAEALEVTRIYGVAGLAQGDGLIERRPFQAPHHTISAAGLVGGGSTPAPGAATLAHNGVLFLDELSEFQRPALEALRQPIEDGRVTIVRGQRTLVFPTRFMLVAATNPCPCGFAGSDRCRCSESDHARHRRRLSGPLLDRIDMTVDVRRPTSGDLGAAPVSDSATLRTRVSAARERQRERLEVETGLTCNAQLDARRVRERVDVSPAGRRALAVAYDRGELSARGHHRVLRVAQTIADLAGAARVHADHVQRAMTLREPGSMVEAAA